MLHTRKPFVIGGIFASLVLVAFGIAAIVIGYQGRQEVRDTLAQENIIGPADSTIPGQLVDTGAEARAQANIMREHQLKSSGGLTYSEMGRYRTPDDNPKGTNDANLAAKDANGKPMSNPVRDSWVTETALSTALNTSYFAEQVGLFAIVMGVALLLTGIGFAVLTVGALWMGVATTHHEEADDPANRPMTTGGTATAS
jgi:hypothetical protein